MKAGVKDFFIPGIDLHQAQISVLDDVINVAGFFENGSQPTPEHLVIIAAQAVQINVRYIESFHFSPQFIHNKEYIFSWMNNKRAFLALSKLKLPSLPWVAVVMFKVLLGHPEGGGRFAAPEPECPDKAFLIAKPDRCGNGFYRFPRPGQQFGGVAIPYFILQLL